MEGNIMVSEKNMWKKRKQYNLPYNIEAVGQNIISGKRGRMWIVDVQTVQGLRVLTCG